MEKEGTRKEVSGWYVKETLSPEEEAERFAEIDAWYEKRHTLNYRTVPLEIPGKMLAALGKLAIEARMEFSEYIEGILAEYLKKQGIETDAETP